MSKYQITDKFVVYLCGPMEQVSIEQGTGWRNRVKDAFKEKDYIQIIDPYDLEQNDDMVQIVEGDKLSIMKADLLIVNSNGIGCGTWMELMFSWEQNKLSYGFGSNVNPWYKYHVTQEFKSLEDIIKQVSLIVH